MNDQKIDAVYGGWQSGGSGASYWGGIGTAALGVAAAAATVATAPVDLAAVALVGGAAAVYVGLSESKQAMSEASSR